jgi:ABC-2 type transport system permease protein
VKLARDTWLIFQRQMLLMVRSPVTIVFSLSYPVTYLLLYAPMLKRALAHDGVTSFAQAYAIYVPGLLALMAFLDGLFTGFALLAEIRSGVIERARVTPVSRVALMLGRALREVATLLGQAVLVTIMALPLGLAVGLGDLLYAYLLLALLSLVSVSLSYGVTLWLNSQAALGPMIGTVSQPMMLLSGMLLPLSIAPLWMIQVAHWNPFYWATNGMRSLFAGHTGAAVVWESLVILAGMAAVTMAWSVRLFARSVR